jgi:hypothetical protein
MKDSAPPTGFPTTHWSRVASAGGPPTPEARAALAELAAWANEHASREAAILPVRIRSLEHWQVAPNLAGIRDGDALAKLSEAERKAWQALWTAVDALLARAQSSRP